MKKCEFRKTTGSQRGNGATRRRGKQSPCMECRQSRALCKLVRKGWSAHLGFSRAAQGNTRQACNEQFHQVRSRKVKINHPLSNHQKTLKPLFTFSGYRAEGYALDWSPTKPGTTRTDICLPWFQPILGNLLTGDNSKNIHLWSPNGTDWNVNQSSYTGHQAAVEDIQWSPTEASGKTAWNHMILM